MAALAAVVVGVIAVAYVLLGSGSDDYAYKARFVNASQLVNGDQVEMGGTAVGSIDDITLTDNGQAEVSFTLEHDYGPLREGTKAIVRQASLSGIANRYIDLQPGPGTNPAMDENAGGEVMPKDDPVDGHAGCFAQPAAPGQSQGTPQVGSKDDYSK